MNVADKVLQCLASFFPHQRITPNTHLYNHLEVDSLAMIEIVMKLEDVFDINISENDIRDVVYVKDIINHLEEVVQ